MFKETSEKHPQLQPPGMGLPKPELFVARILVGIKLRTTSQEQAIKIFTRERQEILALVENVEPSFSAKRVLIKRLPGLEDSSRYWSLYMTLEHLRIVNTFMIDVINSLREEIEPKIHASTAAVKPKDDVDQSVISQFRSVCDQFEKSYTPQTNLNSRTTLKHPWFGELNARQWHFFAGFHMALHKKQIIKIREKLLDT